MKISEEQVTKVRAEINKCKNLPDAMKEDLLDHFCCVIENRMHKGLDFSKALAIAFEEISPNGIDEIQDETLFLLSARKVSLMRRSVRINGIIVLITAPLGVLFKMQHYPAANIILFVSVLCLIFGFLPAFFTNSYKADIQKYMSAKLKNVLGYMSISVLAIAIVFKLCRFSGADILLIAGMFLLFFGYLPFFYFKKLK